MPSYETAVVISPDGLVEIRAYGGSRRHRGNKIGACVRRLRLGGSLECYHRAYDEADGFMPMSLAKYRVVLAKPDSVE